MTDRVLERELGYRIRLAREAQDLGLRRFAREAKIDPGVLSKVENGETPDPRRGFLKSVADRLRVPTDWISYGSAAERIVRDFPQREFAVTTANLAGKLPREVELTLTLSPAYNVDPPFGFKDAAWWSEEIRWLSLVLRELEAGRERPKRRAGITNRNPDPEPNAPASAHASRPAKKHRAA